MNGADLKQLRDALGMTQEALARRLGVDRVTVVRYEKGQLQITQTVELALKQIQTEEGR
jgi:DNA-binding XRE family transcriptional regulator